MYYKNMKLVTLDNPNCKIANKLEELFNLMKPNIPILLDDINSDRVIGVTCNDFYYDTKWIYGTIYLFDNYSPSIDLLEWGNAECDGDWYDKEENLYRVTKWVAICYKYKEGAES